MNFPQISIDDQNKPSFLKNNMNDDEKLFFDIQRLCPALIYYDILAERITPKVNIDVIFSFVELMYEYYFPENKGLICFPMILIKLLIPNIDKFCFDCGIYDQ